MSITMETAAELASSFAAGDLSATELTEAHLEVAAAREPDLNAYTLLDGDRARARAMYVDERRSRGHDLGPLAGVPVAIKDIIDQAGVPTTAGSCFLEAVPERSAPVVSRLEAAGAVITGRTGLHEFAFGFSSENHWWGPVRNPWDPSLSPGGSSGGSAAAVASGSAALALGTDTGGSVRVPAALCGLVGLKVTHGRVPISGVFPLAPSLDTVGVLARSAADAALGYGVIAGDDPADAWATPRVVTAPKGPASPAGLRVVVPRPWVDQPADPDVRRGFTSCLDRMADAGVELIERRFEGVERLESLSDAFSAEVAKIHRRWFGEHPERYGPEVAERVAAALAVPADHYVAGLEWRAAMRHRFERLLEGVDAVVTPAVAANRKTVGVDTIDVAGEALPYRPLLSAFSALVNHTTFPAVVMPLAEPGTPPPSLQLIGPAWGEARLLEIALALEGAGISGFRPPPGSGTA